MSHAFVAGYRTCAKLSRKKRQFFCRATTSSSHRQEYVIEKSLNDLELVKTESYVNGEFRPKVDERFDVINPATGDVLTTVGNASPGLVRNAIENSELAFQTWKKETPQRRANLLRSWHDLIMENVDDLARIITLEQGKPLAEAIGETKYAASYVEWFSGEAVRSYGDHLDLGGKRAITIKQPVGVCAAITPWNFPAAMITRKAAAAIAAGCTMVLKPSELTPLTALALAELSRRANLPNGVFNVVCSVDAAPIGEEMTSSPIVRKITFTGSTPVGKLLMQQASSTVKHVCMELGGLAPFIIMEDSNLKLAAQCLLANKLRNGGQTCISANRVFVHAAVHDLFVAELLEQMTSLRVGNGMEESVDVGPLINEAAVKKVERHLQDAISKGSKLVHGGRRLEELGPTFFEPTVVTEVPEDCIVNDEETFGMLIALMKFQSDDEVIRRANNTRFGLASYLFTESISRAIRMSEALEYGMVGVNESAISDAKANFGGVKESGLGREGGNRGIEEYQETKYICFGGLG